MAQEQRHSEVISRLDSMLSEVSEAFNQARLDESGRAFSRWYSRALSTLALLVVDEEIVFVGGFKESAESTEARIVVFTADRLVLVSILDVSADETLSAVAVARSSLKALSMTASERMDARGYEDRIWPGTLHFELVYEGLDSPLQFDAPGIDSFNISNPTRARVLLDGLRDDLLS